VLYQVNCSLPRLTGYTFGRPVRMCVCPYMQGGPKCMRCSNGIPHSKHADFFKFAEVLIAEVDMRKLSKPVLDDIKGEWCGEQLQQ